MRPNRSSAACMYVSTPSSLETSAYDPDGRRPSSCATASVAAASASATTTAVPVRASLLVTASPIPPAPPVTTATRSFFTPVFSFT